MSVREASSKVEREALVEQARELRRRQTKSERLLWSALRDRRFEGRKFRRQSRIGQFIVDFYCATEQLVVEVDGGIHETQRLADAERQRLLEELGLRVIRVSANDVERALDEVLEAIRGSLTPGPSPSPRERGGRRPG